MLDISVPELTVGHFHMAFVVVVVDRFQPEVLSLAYIDWFAFWSVVVDFLNLNDGVLCKLLCI
jgi:hypothetical protein